MASRGIHLALRVGAAFALILALVAVSAPSAQAQAIDGDECPYGWSPYKTIKFSPDGYDSRVPNVLRDAGCTFLDEVWAQEPFRNAADFALKVTKTASEYRRDGLLDSRDVQRILAAAIASDVVWSKRPVDNSCNKRIAITFDDGPTIYRSAVLQTLRDKEVPATFFDIGLRILANPQLVRAAVADGHLVLNHTYSHPNVTTLTGPQVRDQILRTEQALASIGTPMPFRLFRPPFLDLNDTARAELDALGYAYGNGPKLVMTDDWLLSVSPQYIVDRVVENLQAGLVVVLHDGAMDSAAGDNVVKALPKIIDEARARGYCFGQMNDEATIEAARLQPERTAIPKVTRPVPYHALYDQGIPGVTPPKPYVTVTP